MAPKGRRPGSVRERADWEALLAEARAEGADDDPESASAAPSRRALALQGAREAKRLNREDNLARGVVAKRGSERRPYYKADKLQGLSSGRAAMVSFVPHPLLDDICKVVACLPHDTEIDPSAKAIAEHQLWGSGRQLSTLGTAEQLGLERTALTRGRKTLGSALLSCDILARRSLEFQVGSREADCELVFYVEYERYDESSMPVSIRHSPVDGFCTESSESGPTSSASTSRQVAKKGRWALPDTPAQSSSGVTKLVQSIQSYGMLLKKKGGEGGGGQDCYFMVIGDSITPLQAVDRTTAEVFRHLWRSCTCASLAAKGFASKARAVTADHYAAQLKAERVIRNDLKWMSLIVGCEAHKVAQVNGRTMSIVDDTITGAIHLALSTTLSGMTDKFRASLREVIEERLDWPPRFGAPPDDAQRYRRQCIESLTLGWSMTSTWQRRVLLSMLPSGDWRKRDCVEVYLPVNTDPLPEKRVVAADMARGLTRGLAWYRLAIYPRHRWLGCEAAISQPAIIDACHGLLRPAYERFCSKVGKKAAPPLVNTDLAFS